MADKRGDGILLVIALLCAAFFFVSLHRLWPLAPVNLHRSHSELERLARNYLAVRGISTRGYSALVELRVADNTLTYVERTLGRRRTEELIRSGDLGLVYYGVFFNRRGTNDNASVLLHPNGQVISWRRSLREDEEGARISGQRARYIARQAIWRDFHEDISEWTESTATGKLLSQRDEHFFVYERPAPFLRTLTEKISVLVSGDAISSTARLYFPSSRALEQIQREQGLEKLVNTIGIILLAGGAFAAYIVFLLRLREGMVGLRRSLFWAGAVFLFTLTARFLESLSSEDLISGNISPLLPYPMALLQSVFYKLQESGWILIALLAIIAAADATERKELNASRGESLWRLTKGHFFDHTVARASGRGFLVGLVCAGMMAMCLLSLERLGLARIELQPRGFFITALNAASPSLWTLLYFLHVALLEELAYRYFAGSWLLARTKKAWVAILLPGIVYGLTHTSLTFLPPAEPFWVRPLVLTLVGCIWGWAFFRYDALTVIISHLTADLFIFNWPQIASGSPAIVIPALLTVAIPLIPALGLLRHHLPGMKLPPPEETSSLQYPNKS